MLRAIRVTDGRRGRANCTAAARVAKLLDEATDTVRDLRLVLDVRLPDERLVIEAARITADRSMAYADAFAAALAVTTDAVLWTGDPELLIARAPWKWKDLRPGAR